MTWLNWSLKLHFGLRTIPHLILTHNTQVFVQLMLLSFVWLYMIECDMYAQLLANQTQKDFWVFYMFLKVILYFCALSFCSKCIFVLFKMHFCVVLKKLVQRFFREKLATKSFPQKEFKGKLKISKFIQRVLQLSRDYFSTKHFPQKFLCFSGVFRE